MAKVTIILTEHDVKKMIADYFTSKLDIQILPERVIIEAMPVFRGIKDDWKESRVRASYERTVD